MPVHLIHTPDHAPGEDEVSFEELVSTAVARIQSRERIVAAFPRGGTVVIITEPKPGRPAKETR